MLLHDRTARSRRAATKKLAQADAHHIHAVTDSGDVDSESRGLYTPRR